MAPAHAPARNKRRNERYGRKARIRCIKQPGLRITSSCKARRFFLNMIPDSYRPLSSHGRVGKMKQLLLLHHCYCKKKEMIDNRYNGSTWPVHNSSAESAGNGKQDDLLQQQERARAHETANAADDETRSTRRATLRQICRYIHSVKRFNGIQ